MVKFFKFDYISIHISRQSSLFSLEEHLQINPTSLAKWNPTSLVNFVLERDQKNIFYYQCNVENYTNQVLDFLLFDKHENTNGIFSLFLKIWLTESIPIFREQFSEEIASSWLLTFNWSQVFPDKKKAAFTRMALRTLVRKYYGGKLPAGIK